MKPLRIYVASPYTAETPKAVQANVDRAIDAGIMLLAKGHLPYIPHLSHYLELRNAEHARTHGIRLTYDDYLHMDEAWLEVCTALLYLAPSPGADKELAYAKERGMQIFGGLDEVLDAFEAEPPVDLR